MKTENIKVHIVAAVVIKQKDKYLLIQEKKPRAYGLWNLPGGLIDAGETSEQAAIREAKEETNYDVELIKKLGIFHTKPIDAIIHVFEAKIIGGELKFPEDEILDAKWLTFNEIKQIENKLRNDHILKALTILENKK